MNAEQQGVRRFLFSKPGLASLVLLGFAGYFLWTEYPAQVISALPWLLVGGCLVMHLFMHGGHGGHGGGTGGNGGPPKPPGGGGRSA